MMEYGWRGGPKPELDVQRAGEYIDSLGTVEAEDLVQKARSLRSPLHSYFEWDDGVAGHEFRLVQARVLLASIVVVTDDGTAPTTRAFVAIQKEPTQYVSTGVAMSDSGLREQVLRMAFADFKRWEQKYHELQELADIFTAAERVRAVVA